MKGRIGFAGCKHTTLDAMKIVLRSGYTIDHLITIDSQKGQEQAVAGYMDLQPFCEEANIPYYIVDKYILKSDKDKEQILRLGLNILLVVGWQRLIPDWFLSALSIGAFGMHRASKPLPFGRGRSPLNWSLIQNKDIFYTTLFHYKLGIDDGDIVGVQTFDTNPFDTCETLHFKNVVSMGRLLTKHLPTMLDRTSKCTLQPQAKATYYPKCDAEDGLIHFQDSTLDIYNLIRAVTRPFPGAFAFLDDNIEMKIIIWQAQPFDTQLTYSKKAGEIVEVFYNGQFVVSTGDNTLLVTDYEGFKVADKLLGHYLGTAGISKKIWPDLPE